MSIPAATVDRARTHTTLQDLVLAVQDATTSDRESVAVIAHMLSTRRAMLGGRAIRVSVGGSR